MYFVPRYRIKSGIGASLVWCNFIALYIDSARSPNFGDVTDLV